MEVEIVVENERGCGFRHSGPEGVGIYLVDDPGPLTVCPRLPFPLEVCPCCGSGVKFSRGFTWIDPSILLAPDLPPATDFEDTDHDAYGCRICNPAAAVGNRAGLIWVGAKHYTTAAHFSREANVMGISRRINAVPNDFRVGIDAIYLAHVHAKPPPFKEYMENPSAAWKPGIFRSFVPSRVELVIDDPDDIPEKAVRLAERFGDRARIIKVIPNQEASEGVLDDE